MNKLLYFVLGLGIGIGGGVLGTRSYFRSKSETVVKEALKQLAEAKENAENNEKTSDKKDVEMPEVQQSSPLTETKPDIMSFYKDKVEDNGYTDYSTQVEGDSNIDKRFHEEPYVISPEAIGTMDGYEVISLTLFDDGVLTDDDFEPMEQDEIADCIGEDYQDHFGDFEDDAVHIRNDIHRVDYEILKDLRTYDEVARLKPKKARLNE